MEYVIVTCLDRQLRDPLGVVNDQLQQVQVLESYALQGITKINFSQNKFNGIFNEYHSETSYSPPVCYQKMAPEFPQ